MNRIPIRARISLLTGLIGLIVVIVLAVTVYHHTAGSLGENVDRSLREEYGEMISIIIDPQRSLSGLRLDSDDQGLEVAQVIDSAGNVVDATPGAGDLDLWALGVAGEGPVTVRRDELDVPLRVMVAPVSIQGRPTTIAVAASIERTDSALADLRWRLAAAAALATLLIASVSYAIVGLALRPVERMRAQAAAISPRRPGDRLALPPARDELHRLGETFNRTIHDLEAAVQERQAFIASASHELRTPLTNLRAELEWAQNADRSAEEMRAAIDGAATDTSHLIDLSEALLDLTLVQVHCAEARYGPVEIEPIVADAVDAAGSSGVMVDTAEDLWVIGDQGELSRLVVNLVTNALIHGREPVTVGAAAENGEIKISVADHGPGIPASIRAQAFVAFVRADEAHQRPGAGLGLAVVAEIVARHGGTIEVSPPATRSQVTVRLPRCPSGRTDPPAPLTKAIAETA